MRQSANRVRPGVERLESREVLDAGVSAVLGTLRITGTNLAEAFRVTEIEVEGVKSYKVEALVHNGVQGTFNDGKTSEVFRASRITADLGHGNDLLILQDLTTRTTRSVVSLGPIGRGLGAFFGPGMGFPRPVLSLRTIPGDVNVSTGAGNDEVRLVDAAVAGKVAIDLGAGHDVAVIGSSSATSSVEVKGRQGEDHFADLGENDYGTVGLKLSSLIAAHRESTDGQVTRLDNPTAENPLGTMDWTAAGQATHMGSYTEAGSHNFTAPNAAGVGQVLNGTFTSTAEDGSTISGTYFGTYTILPDDMARFNVTALWQRGTGRLAGVTGRAEVVALMEVSAGTFHFDTNGTWTFP
jgi:hypothetical protein